MKVCAISQPVYLPWVGYFNLLARADQFIFLDDAQFSKNGFGNRNRIPTQPEPTFLTVPVRKGTLEKSFQETFIDDSQNWRAKHLKSISLTYRKAESFEAVFNILEKNLNNKDLNTLAALSIALITDFAKYLNLSTQFSLSSKLAVGGERSEKILRICEHLGCDTYVSAAGARAYIEEDGVLLKSHLKVHFVNIMQEPYTQITGGDFVPQMSIVDLLFNLPSDKAVEYILDCDKK